MYWVYPSTYRTWIHETIKEVDRFVHLIDIQVSVVVAFTLQSHLPVITDLPTGIQVCRYILPVPDLQETTPVPAFSTFVCFRREFCGYRGFGILTIDTCDLWQCKYQL